MTFITPDIKESISELYNSPDRHYHNSSHVNSLLDLLDHFRPAFTEPEVVEAAIWFHDAVYDPQADGGENELHSAELAVSYLSGKVEHAELEKVWVMILATAGHDIPQGVYEDYADDAGFVQDLMMFLDMDMSILGTARRDFERYEAAVREEYAWMDDGDWRTGRAAVLRAFQDRERIYLSDIFWVVYEEKARANIARSLARLEQ